MTYSEVRAQIVKVRKKHSELKKEEQRLEAEATRLVEEKKSMTVNFNSELEHMKNNALRQEVARSVVQLENDLEKVVSDKHQLHSEYESNLSTVNEDSIYIALKKKSPISISSGKELDMVKELVENEVGTRFVGEYLNQMDSSSIKLTENEIAQSLERFKDSKAKIEKFAKGTNHQFIDNAVDSFTELVNEKLDNSGRGILIFAGVTLVLGLLLSWIVFPIYLLFLTYVVVKNVRTGSLLVKTLMDFKAVSDNLGQVESNLRKKANRIYENKVNKLKEEFEKLDSDLSIKEEGLREAISETRDKAATNFVFDDSMLRRSFGVAIADLDSRMAQNNNAMVQCRKEQEFVSEELKTLNDALKETVNSVTLEYLNFEQVGSAKVLSSNFLLDIKDNKPEFWQYPNTSCMFIYDHISTVENFVKLISSQLRTRMNPFNLRMQVWDEVNKGLSFTPFVKKQHALFSVASTKDEMLEKVSEITDIINRRVDMVLREYEDINLYNQAMIEQKSVTEPYYFIYQVATNRSLYNDESYIQNLRVGGRAGIYFNIFVSSSSLSKDLLPVVDAVGKIYNLQSEGVRPWARQYTIDQLHQFGK